MDIAALRQAFTAVPVAAPRADTIAPRGAAPTELPADQTVSSAREGDGVRKEPSSNAALLAQMADLMQRSTRSTYERDRDTGTLVFKSVDVESGSVVMQLPDQSLLNLRAYLQQAKDAVVVAVRKTA